MKHTQSRAFTLIELLVVIAIIAILAAILFPVFAQAKLAAKKTQAISNVKNIATATIIYQTDNDDYFPLTNVTNPTNGRTSYNRFVPTPAKLANGFTSQEGIDAFTNFYSNSLLNYIKNEQIWDDPSATSTTSVYNLSIADGMPFQGGSNYSYQLNGLLNAYSTTAVNSPARLIMFSQNGRRKTPGASFANPAMGCLTITATCLYQPGVVGCSTANNGTTSFFSRSTGGAGWDVYGSAWVNSFTDGHAKVQRMGVFTNGDTDPRIDPMTQWSGLNGKNTATVKRWWSGPDPAGCHAYLFRPDLDFGNWDTAIAL